MTAKDTPLLSLAGIISLIEAGAEAVEVYALALECIFAFEEVAGATLYLPCQHDNTKFEPFGTKGPAQVAALHTDYDYQVIGSDFGEYRFRKSDLLFFPAINLGITNGGIAVKIEAEASAPLIEAGNLLTRIIGLLTEQQSLSRRLQHFIDRLHILNNLHQLIAANVSVSKIVKSVVREAAFRFGADVGLIYVLNYERALLQLQGGFGCSPSLIPKELKKEEGLLGKVISSGTHIAIPDITAASDTGLQFLGEAGVTALDTCCLEVRGDPLGVIILGFRSNKNISAEETTRFEELSRMAGVAIANAQSQERIKAYTERLEELVESRTKDLAIQTERAQEANKAKSRFLANMSHELRTPLTAIVGYSSILADGLFGELNEKQKDALLAITRSSQHLKNLIDDVLNLARIESGKEEPEPTQVPLEELLQQVFKLMQQQAVSKNIKLEQPRIPENIEHKSIFADQKHIHQVLINLTSNAIKYTPEGGRVWIEVEQIEDKVKLSVSDNGVGISEEKQKKLFERFERGDDSYSRQQEGTGIGLNLTKRLVQINDGGIGCHSEEGNGSTFWVIMPTASIETTKEIVNAQTEAKGNLRLDGLTGIVVDDNAETLQLLEIIIQGAGADVRMCNGVKVAQQAIEETGTPDFILTDLAMPGESGLDLIQWARARRDLPRELPIIVLSACAFEEDREAASDVGASFFLAKPFRPSEVLGTIRNLTISAAMRRKRKLR